MVEHVYLTDFIICCWYIFIQSVESIDKWKESKPLETGAKVLKAHLRPSFTHCRVTFFTVAV